MADKNKLLLDDLNDMFDAAIKRQLKRDHKNICESEFLHVRHVLNQAVKSFTFKKGPRIFIRNTDFFMDILETLEAIAKEIDHEGLQLERELQGTQNYSEYESQRVKQYASKVALRQDLHKMIDLIRANRPDLFAVKNDTSYYSLHDMLNLNR